MQASQEDFDLRQRPYFSLLSQAQLERIYDAALEVLARTGGEFHDPAAVNLLADSGARVEDGNRVRIPDTLVADALQSAPRRIVICDREGQSRLFLEDRNSYFGPGSDTPYTLDPVSGERRPAVLDDVGRAARVTDALPELDFCMCFGLAGDVPQQVSDLHHFAAMVRNTGKPLVVTAWDLDGLRNIHRMMQWVAGDKATLNERPFVVVFLMAISPLRFPADSLQKLMYCAGNNLIHDLGYLDNGMTSSLELLTICNELVSQTRRFLKGIPVMPETLAVDTIAAIGPGNHYLTHPQTKAHHRRQIWMPELISRKGYDAWLAEGEMSLRQRARTKLLNIMETHRPRPLAPEIVREMNELLDVADRSCDA